MLVSYSHFVPDDWKDVEGWAVYVQSVQMIKQVMTNEVVTQQKYKGNLLVWMTVQ